MINSSWTTSGMETSKSRSQRVRELFPSLRPSCLSVILVFVCGVLWLKNEATNDRLITLERQMNAFTDEYYALPLDTARSHTPPTENLRVIPGMKSFVKDLISQKISQRISQKSPVCSLLYVCVFFWLIRSFADPTYTFSRIIVRGPLNILLLFFISFGTVGLYRSDILCFL